MNTNEWPEITVDTTLDELREIHECIWDYAIEHLRKPITPYFSNCAFCEYMRQMYSDRRGYLLCRECPISAICKGDLYDCWLRAYMNKNYGNCDPDIISIGVEAARAIHDLAF